MKKLLLILPFILLVGCEYRYRYPCQDPANWGKPECSNEECKADGECTSHVLGLPDNTQPSSTWNRPPPGTSKFGQEDSGCKDDKPSTEKPSWRKPTKPATFEKSSQIDFEDTVAMKTDKVIPVKVSDGQESLYREPMGLSEEKPLTMDTIVNTKAHNKAAS